MGPVMKGVGLYHQNVTVVNEKREQLGRWTHICVSYHKTIFISANRTITNTCNRFNHWQTTNLLRLELEAVEAIAVKIG